VEELRKNDFVCFSKNKNNDFFMIFEEKRYFFCLFFCSIKKTIFYSLSGIFGCCSGCVGYENVDDPEGQHRTDLLVGETSPQKFLLSHLKNSWFRVQTQSRKLKLNYIKSDKFY
jgi:hypothetical protein